LTVANQSLTVYRGTDALLVFTAETPTACAGWTVLLTLRDFNGVLIIALSGTVTDAVVGVLSFPDPRNTTLAQPAGMVFFSLDRVDAGAEDHLAGGTITFTSTARSG
jgi:hypothetical protein